MESTARKERLRYVFVGRVQNRGFRFACVTCARKEGLTGWVRNERNGTVTAEVQGSSTGQLAFLRRLSTLVPGFGDNWSVGSEKPVSLVDDERDFGVRRY